MIAQPDIVIDLPIYIRLGKSQDRFSLNLNIYRNAHFHTLSTAKSVFENIVMQRISHLPVMTRVDLTYRLFFGSKRAIDVANICCIVDKFFCDTLVNQKKLIDDNMDNISAITYRWGGVDKYNPRVEVTLGNIQTLQTTKDNTMRIMLTQVEIEDAIKDVVLQQITLREDQDITIAFEGVKDGEFSVHVTILKQEGKQEETLPKKVRTRKATQTETDSPESSPPVAPSTFTNPVEAMPPVEPVVPPVQPVADQEPLPVAPRKIFPDISTSAPTQTQVQPAPSTPVSGKSLFSNLQKPVHDPVPE